MKAIHPLFKPSVIGVDVLDVIRPTYDSDASGGIDLMMLNTYMSGDDVIGRGTIGAQDDVRG